MIKRTVCASEKYMVIRVERTNEISDGLKVLFGSAGVVLMMMAFVAGVTAYQFRLF